jgi:UDP-glucose 4-epimerase
MSILITGGAGYIGSHMVKHLLDRGEEVLVLDNLSTGFRSAVVGAELIEGDCGSEHVLEPVFRRSGIDTIMHFASFSEVGRSVAEPESYYLNNVGQGLNLIKAARALGVNNFIFSSTAAVYGNSGETKIPESTVCAPINPYGRTKLLIEQALQDYSAAYNFNFVSLRYFNAAGAHANGGLGERHNPETHLIPLVLQAASGRRDAVQIFGRDHKTGDGTCVRDYIHVDDLCAAHGLALNWLRDGKGSAIFNIGNGKGYSVQEIIEASRAVTKKPIKIVDAPQRPGDPPFLVADSELIRTKLGWQPVYPDLHSIIEHAWRWELQKGILW